MRPGNPRDPRGLKIIETYETRKYRDPRGLKILETYETRKYYRP